MAAPNGTYFAQEKLKTPAAHHESLAKLWETKWKKPAELGIYPFMFGAAEDFDCIIKEMIRLKMHEPYDWDAYAEVFRPQAETLTRIAEEAEAAGEKRKASEYYLRSSAVWCISRFPIPRSKNQYYAWEQGKKACLKGLQLREHPVHELLINHTHAVDGDGTHISIYYQLPPGASKENPVPLVILISGLDGYRTELAAYMGGWCQQGVGTIAVEIPGTADSPALKNDPKSPDRQWSSLLDWVDAQEGIDHERVAVWAFSTGAVYGIRLAYTHHDRVTGVVAQGGGCHHMFDKKCLANSLAYKFGYGHDVEGFKKEAHKFSLFNDGLLDKAECARLLMVNGTEDEIFPIDDYYLALQHGPPKEARFIPGVGHMGEPESSLVIIGWIYKLFGIEGNVGEQAATIPFKPRY